MPLPALAIGISAGISAVSSLFGGSSSRRAARKKARLQRLQTQEAVRLKENEIQDFEAQQTVSFAKAGVLLEGTPLDVLEATRAEGERQKQNILTTGNAQAAQTNAQGRANFIQGIAGAAGSIANGVGNIAKL